MIVLKRCATCLLAALAAMASTQYAEAATVRNDLDLGVKGVYCLGSDKPELITGAISPGGSVGDLVVPDWCQGLALHLETDGSWQFAVKAAPGNARNIVFSMEAPGPNSEEKHPSMLMELESGGDVVSPAGGIINTFRGLLIHGMEPAQWLSYAFPLPDAAENDGKFVVSFGGVSWSLADRGIVFDEVAEGVEAATDITLEAPFTNPIVSAIFSALRNLGLNPRLFQHYRGTGELVFEFQFAPDPWAEEGKEWLDLDDQMAIAADVGGGRVEISFDTEEYMFELILNLDSGKAKLQIYRNPDAAFG